MARKGAERPYCSDTIFIFIIILTIELYKHGIEKTLPAIGISILCIIKNNSK